MACDCSLSLPNCRTDVGSWHTLDSVPASKAANRGTFWQAFLFRYAVGACLFVHGARQQSPSNEYLLPT